MCWLVLLVTLHLALCSSSLLSMSVAIPQVQFLDRLFRLPMKPVAIPRVQLLDKVLFPLLFRLVLLVIQRRKRWRFRSCRFSTSSFRFLSWCRGRFPWSFSGPRCSCIMAGMDQKDFRALLPCRSHARCVQRQVPLVLETVQAHFLDKVVCYVWCRGPDSAAHCLAVPQLQFITVVDTPYAQWQFPMVLFVQKTIEIPQFVFGGRCPCLQVFHRAVVDRQFRLTVAAR